MKETYIYIFVIMSMIFGSFLTTGCDDDFKYSKDYSVYDGVTLNINMADENNVLNLNLVNTTYRVRVNVTPNNVRINSQEYLYEIEDETIATVDENGLLTMKKEGETKLTVKLAVRPEVSTSCTINVKPIVVNKINVPSEITMKYGTVIDLKERIKITPAIANCELTYSIADEDIATIDNEGVITAGLNGGNTIITITTTDGSNISETVNLTVEGKKFITEIILPADLVESKDFTVGQALNIAKFTTVLPEDAEEPEKIKYSIKEGDKYVSVTEDGTVTCNAEGTATIIAEATDGNKDKVTSEITINVIAAGNGWFERALYTVDTSCRYSDGLNYIPDGNTGKPEHILDGNFSTYLSVKKPEAQDPGNPEKEIFFIVDLGGITTFNTVGYEHRHLNNTLAASKIEISGSNDGNLFTIIKNDVEVPYSATPYSIELGTQNYRYIKVKATDWIPYTGSTGSSLQVAEFNIGNITVQP